MIRVCEVGGYIAFDMYSDMEWTQEDIDSWINRTDNWPVVLPEKKVIDIFTKCSGENRRRNFRFSKKRSPVVNNCSSLLFWDTII